MSSTSYDRGAMHGSRTDPNLISSVQGASLNTRLSPEAAARLSNDGFPRLSTAGSGSASA